MSIEILSAGPCLQMPFRVTPEVFERIDVPAIQRDRRDSIRKMAAALLLAEVEGSGLEKVSQSHPMAKTEDHFSGGVYTRTIRLPAGLRVIGMRHRQEHINIVASGRATVMTEFGRQEIEGPCQFVSPAGTQRFLWIHEDMVWTTVHRTDKTTSEDAFADVFIDETELVQNLIGGAA